MRNRRVLSGEMVTATRSEEIQYYKICKYTVTQVPFSDFKLNLNLALIVRHWVELKLYQNNKKKESRGGPFGASTLAIAALPALMSLSSLNTSFLPPLFHMIVS